MITAVDTCILIDVFQGTGDFALPSAQALSQARREGQIIICELVYAELAAFAETRPLLDALLAELGVQVIELAWTQPLPPGWPSRATGAPVVNAATTSPTSSSPRTRNTTLAACLPAIGGTPGQHSPGSSYWNRDVQCGQMSPQVSAARPRGSRR